MATPTFVAAGANATTATTGAATIALPVGIVDGQYVQLAVFSSPSSAGAPAAPAGWTQRVSVVGGLGTEGLDDQGTRRLTVYSPTDPAVAPTVAPVVGPVTGQTSLGGNTVAYALTTPADQWSLVWAAATYDAITTAKPVPPAYAAWSTTTVPTAAGDLVVAATVINTDGAGAGSSRAITGTGLTFAAHTTRGSALSTGAGNDSRLDLGDSAATAGSATVVLAYAATYATAPVAGVSPSGATVLTRLREVTPSTGVDLYTRVTGTAGDPVATTGNTGTVFSRVVVSGAASMVKAVPAAGVPNWGVTARVISGAAGGSAYAEYGSALIGEQSAGYVQARVLAEALPALPISVLTLTEGGTARARLQVGADGKVRVLDSASTVVWTSTTTLTAGTQYVLALFANTSTGAYQARIYPALASGAVVEDSGAKTGAGLGAATHNTARYGLTADQGDVPGLQVQDMAYSSTTWPVRQVITSAPPTITVGPNQVGVEPGATVTLAASGTASSGGAVTITWAQVGGTTLTITQGAGGSATFTAPYNVADQTYTLRATGSDGSQSATASMTVTVLRSTETYRQDGVVRPASLRAR